MAILNEQLQLPEHIGIIMDGNRRWAKQNGLSAALGHSKGAEVIKNLVLYCNKIGLKHLTVFAFSTENWHRSEKEISALMLIFRKYLKMVIKKFEHENIKIQFFGDISKFPQDIQDTITVIENETKIRTGLNFNIAINYGSRAEIVRATKIITQKVQRGDLKIEDITENILSENLYTKNIPDVDLIIRTGGEKRLSNFLLWQCAYAEFYYTQTLWPDFSEKKFDEAILEYFNRKRRFGR